MAGKRSDIKREVDVPCDRRETLVGSVTVGETWSFSASGQWTNGFIRCGPNGYRNFLADAFQIAPREKGQPWLCLMGCIRGEPDSTFPIGAGCTETFARTGDLVVFANDEPDGYSNNRGFVKLVARRGGVAPTQGADMGGWIGAWHRFRDVFSRTAGIPVIAAFVFGVSWILVCLRQGQDLVRGIGEDDFLQYPSGILQITFALGLLFLALQAWGWSRLIVASNYGADRSKWRPRWFLVWTPRVLGAVPFVGAATALMMNPARNTGFVAALIALGLIFFAFVVWRQEIGGRLSRRAGAGWLQRLQRYWVAGSLIGAAVAMILATLWPARIGVWVGAPAVVFFGLGFIIPVIVILVQLGSSLRIPVTGGLLGAAVLFGLWVDNHGVGRRAFAAAVTGPTDRLTLSQAYAKWKAEQMVGSGGKMTMLLVAVQGGASRAGYWTALVLSRLREVAKAKGVDIDKRLFAISSVSGGSVGAVGYAGLLKEAPNAPDFKNRLLRFAGEDALGPALTGMLFPDLLQRFLPISFLPDRAEALERAWENAWREMTVASDAPEATAALMRQPFLALAPRADEPWRPILIVQGASENGGRRVLTGGVRLATDEVDAEDFEDSMGHDVAASTAILNGARFPWVSPGGTFPSKAGARDHILDGGYFDNAGAETLREMERALRAIRAEAGDTVPLDIVFVLIGYRDPNVAPTTPALAVNDVFAPLFGVFASMSAHETHLAREMKLVGQSKLEQADPYTSRMTGGPTDYAAIVLCPGKIDKGGELEDYEPPMDWTLSGEAKRYIENSLIPTSPACNAKANVDTIDAIVARLKR